MEPNFVTRRIMVCGHRDCDEDVVYNVIATVCDKYDDFDLVCGGAIGADLVAAEAFLELNEQGTLHVFQPYIGHERRWSEDWRKRLYRVLAHERCAITVCDTGPWRKGIELARNRCMLNFLSGPQDVCVAFVGVDRLKDSGTGYTVRLADTMARKVVRYEPDAEKWY